MSSRMDRREARIERKAYQVPRGSGLKQLILLVAVAFVVTLGVVVGTRMSSDAIAVLLGVIAGVAASIPCALLLMTVTRRQQTAVHEPYPAVSDPVHTRYDDCRDSLYSGSYARHPAPPPVIVVTPGTPWSSTPGADGATLSPYAGYASAQPQGQREFRVMGYEEPESQADWEA